MGEDQTRWVRPVYISVSLIVKRNLATSTEKQKAEEIIESLMGLETVRLDRENLSAIGNLECLGPVHSLYLQHNNIKKIENLEFLSNLRFLTLAGNKICKTENLKSLEKLGFLDLSDNLIDHLALGEMPKSLFILNLKGNPCVKEKGYRDRVAAALPCLKELDGQSVTRKVDYEEEEREESSEDEEEYATPWSLEKIHDFFNELREEMSSRRTLRKNNATKEHECRMDEIQDLKNSVTGLTAPGKQAGQGTPASRDCSLQTTLKSSREANQGGAGKKPGSSDQKQAAATGVEGAAELATKRTGSNESSKSMIAGSKLNRKTTDTPVQKRTVNSAASSVKRTSVSAGDAKRISLSNGVKRTAVCENNDSAKPIPLHSVSKRTSLSANAATTRIKSSGLGPKKDSPKKDAEAGVSQTANGKAALPGKTTSPSKAQRN
ncbi:leucine-rich repeat-containing protein 46-like [Acipenser oxyrinchus oxyrinchus]|uniref:Leucine-rich repeat-containing protein 46-like n=1 Tax=Acipenser oxyrinchus oxyrinchus TaxID=40147 RepID=A0AAD8G0Z8_ACIOX|nr:leucine-rich repeat-containing protein 46-like [Acipenser oxyrinchus oxyrinchus]